MIKLMTEDDLAAKLDSRSGAKAVIFKHSTQCPISAAAYRQVEQFDASHDTPVYLIRVIEERPLSNLVAKRYGIAHASPQAIVLDGHDVVWHASHYAITSDALAQAVQ